VKPQSVSTPPVTTTSTTPIPIRRAALAMAFALDAHAVDTTCAGPVAPNAWANTRAGECSSCCAT
jgi:hypothetical protein